MTPFSIAFTVIAAVLALMAYRAFTNRKPKQVIVPRHHTYETQVFTTTRGNFLPLKQGLYYSAANRNDVITELMLYTILTDHDLYRLPTPPNYTEGMTFDAAKDVSLPVLAKYWGFTGPKTSMRDPGSGSFFPV